jgi:hypothetical protein
MDKWASWLLHRRDGDDPEQRVKALEHLIPIRNRVLENARLSPGEVLLDVGAGDAFQLRAVERLPASITLGDEEPDLFDPFIRREPPSTRLADTAPPDGSAPVRGA